MDGDAMKRRRCRALSTMMLFTQPARAPLFHSLTSLPFSRSFATLILPVYSRSRCHQPRAMQLPHSRVIRFVPPKVLISTPPCHLRNLFGTLSPQPSNTTATLSHSLARSFVRTPRRRAARQRKGCLSAFLHRFGRCAACTR